MFLEVTLIVINNKKKTIESSNAERMKKWQEKKKTSSLDIVIENGKVDKWVYRCVNSGSDLGYIYQRDGGE